MSELRNPIRARTFPFVLVTIGLVVGANTVASLGSLGPSSATAITAGLGILLWGWALWQRDRRLLAWLLIGYAAGFTELLADWWLVTRTESLVYPADEARIVVSPLYMPIAWGNILAQLGILVHGIRDRWGIGVATVLGALIAGANIPLYEHLADGAGWWYYRDTPMLFDAPYYIILGEFLLGLPFAWLDYRLDRDWLAAVPLGVLTGLGILVAYVLAWWLVGPCEGAILQLPCP